MLPSVAYAWYEYSQIIRIRINAARTSFFLIRVWFFNFVSGWKQWRLLWSARGHGVSASRQMNRRCADGVDDGEPQGASTTFIPLHASPECRDRAESANFNHQISHRLNFLSDATHEWLVNAYDTPVFIDSSDGLLFLINKNISHLQVVAGIRGGSRSYQISYKYSNSMKHLPRQYYENGQISKCTQKIKYMPLNYDIIMNIATWSLNYKVSNLISRLWIIKIIVVWIRTTVTSL